MQGNPRTHVGCDLNPLLTITAIIVSIHAPTWGATRATSSSDQPMTVSIHAPTWGATNESLRRIYRLCFNPRTHVGCDIAYRMLCTSISGFNPRTHVGCDFLNLMKPTLTGSFNPRTHVGCDSLCIGVKYVGIRFQSTHPRGVRQ